MSPFTRSSTGAGGSGALPNAAAGAGITGWHQALGRVMSGAGDATLLCLGESILSGLFTNNIGPGPTTQMIRVLAGALGVPVVAGLAVPPAGTLAGPDNRWAVGAGWSNGVGAAGESWGGVVAANGQTEFFGANGAAGNLVYSPTGTFDTFDVYSIGGSFSVRFGAGGTDTVLGSLSGLQKTTVSSTPTANPICVMHAPTSFGCKIIGVDPRLSTTPTLRVGNASTTSASTGGNASNAGWTNTTATAGTRPTDCITFYNPNATLFNISQPNDQGQGLTLAQTLANWTALASLARACQSGTGGVIFASENPCNPSTSPTPAQTAYWAACKNFCAQNGYGFIDVFANLNGATTGFAVLSAMNPSYYGDGNSIHPSTNPGSPDYGRQLGLGLLAL